jgi:HPt (histidine-containing phosphotransfer) domain-containing protein
MDGRQTLAADVPSCALMCFRLGRIRTPRTHRPRSTSRPPLISFRFRSTVTRFRGTGVAQLTPMHTADRETAPILDGVALGELERLGADVVSEIVQSFVLDVPQRLIKLRSEVAVQSSAGIVREIHALKGSALAVGATRLARLCAAIERDARAGFLDEAMARSSEIESVFEDVRGALPVTPMIASHPDAGEA